MSTSAHAGVEHGLDRLQEIADRVIAQARPGEQVEAFVPRPGARRAEPERLYSPEEAAAYLGVHVQTVRAWIRSARLPARRLAGQRALRIRASDLEGVLEPLAPGDGE